MGRNFMGPVGQIGDDKTMTQMKTTDVVVLGGGAAGLMCAALAAQRGRRVQVLEKARRVGRKILMSGGGRCNFTNLYSSPEDFISDNPHFCKSALARYTPADFLALVADYDIAYHEKEKGQLFCDKSSKDIVRMLLAECERAGVVIHTRQQIESVQLLSAGGFQVDTGQGSWQAESVVVATGGLSIPTMGSSDFGIQLARQFGLAVQPPRAGLVPLTLPDWQRRIFAELTGVALPVEVSCRHMSFDGGMLFTHRGLSGPTMLQISSYWQAGDVVAVNLLPDVAIQGWLQARRRARPQARLANVLAERLPKRLSACLCRQAGPQKLGDARLQSLSDKDLATISAQLAAWPFYPDGTEGYKTAEVMLGGVATSGLSSSTLAAHAVPGLFFIGEVVDVTGHLGGHNFQWAWASAHAAAQVV